MRNIAKLLSNRRYRYIMSAVCILLALVFLFIPITYNGFIEYIIKNTIVNMNTGEDIIEVQKASLAIFMGAKIDLFPAWGLYLLTILGGVFLYLGIAIPYLKQRLLSKDYWMSISLK